MVAKGHIFPCNSLAMSAEIIHLTGRSGGLTKSNSRYWVFEKINKKIFCDETSIFDKKEFAEE